MILLVREVAQPFKGFVAFKQSGQVLPRHDTNHDGNPVLSPVPDSSPQEIPYPSAGMTAIVGSTCSRFIDHLALASQFNVMDTFLESFKSAPKYGQLRFAFQPMTGKFGQLQARRPEIHGRSMTQGLLFDDMPSSQPMMAVPWPPAGDTQVDWPEVASGDPTSVVNFSLNY